MNNIDGTDSIRIQTFKTIQDVRDLPNFRDNNPVNLKNYNDVLGDYDFSEDVKCCREKTNGNLCGREHRIGYVVVLKDNSVSILGNVCAKDHFDLDTKVRKDIAKYENEKRRLSKLARLNELFAKKKDNLDQIDSLRSDLKILRDRKATFLDAIGSSTAKNLQDKAQSGNPSVEVGVIKYKVYTDEYDEERRNKQVTLVRIGVLKGLSIFTDYVFRAIYHDMNEIIASYDEANSVSHDIKLSKLEKLTSSIAKIDQVKNDVMKVEQEAASFFDNDLTLLCYLTDDKSDRFKTARAVLELNGEQVGKEKAKSWLLGIDHKIKEELKADKIEIQY